MNVTIVGPSLRVLGGQAVQADLLLRHWKDDPDLDANFVAIDPSFPHFLGWVRSIRFLRTLVRFPFFLADVWRGTASAEIVHIFSASYWSFLLGPVPAWIVSRLRGKKCIINYRSGEAPDHIRRSAIARTVLARVDGIVVPSRYLFDVFRKCGLTATVVPNIVDLTQCSYRARQPVRPRLVCTRMFEPYYQVDLVIRSFAEVSKIYPEARLCLVGAGNEEGKIRQLVECLELKTVEFAGAVPRSNIGRYYDEADIFINASRLDNMPVSILEAFSSGTPVVSTGPDGIRYLVEHERTGLLCETHDWKALAANVIRLLRDPDLAFRLAENARCESQRYCWSVVRGQWLNLYRSVVALDRPNRPDAVTTPATSLGTYDDEDKEQLRAEVLSGRQRPHP
jgi:L-malate glycosyltransferase